MPSTSDSSGTPRPNIEASNETAREASRDEKNNSMSGKASTESRVNTGHPTTSDHALAQDMDDIEYPGTKQAWLIMIAIMFAQFLTVLDRTIIATAIPQMTDEFNSLADVGWYGSAFLLTSAAPQLLVGKLYTYYTPKYCFLSTLVLFEIGSAICGAAPSSTVFIVGRAVAGLGAAGLLSGAIILMTTTLPLHKRPFWQGLFGAVSGVGSVIGPLLGGAFTSGVSWRWCFYINLPIGAISLVIILLSVKPTAGTNRHLTFRQKMASLDLLGEMFLVPSVVCLLLALQWGGSTYSWGDGRMVALQVVFAVLLIAFICVQLLLPKTCTLPASIIFNRNILGAIWFSFCLFSSMILVLYFLPIWFQAILGVSAVQSGIDTLPLVLSMSVFAIVGGQLIGRIGYYNPVVYAGCVFIPLGAGLISTLSMSSDTGKWVGFQILFGIGMGLGLPAGMMPAQACLSRKDVPTGIAIVFFFQLIGSAVFLSVGQNLLSTGLVANLQGVVHGITPEYILSTGATDLRQIVPTDQLSGVLSAYNLALRRVFYASAGVGAFGVVGAFLLEWKSVKKGKNGKVQAVDKSSTDRKTG